MTRSVRTTKIHMDSSALTRLMEVSREADLYSNRRQADQDNYEALIHLLCDEFESGGGA